MKEISDKQKDIIVFINAFIERHSYSPSVREIAEACNINSSTVAQYHLNILERKGYIRRGHKVFRSITLPDMQNREFSIPMMGTIAAGSPIPVPGNDGWTTLSEDNIEIPKDLIRGRDDVYALRVKGTSMIDALIDDGDIVLLQQVSSVEDGTTVAVWLKDKQEVTLKKIYREGDRVCLKPANKTMKPLYCKSDNVEIQGKVIGIIRTL
jgi:repressor LexA